jgi:CHAT domain-containing protein
VFLGVGDPVYNTADPRLARSAPVRPAHASPFDLFAAGAEPRSAYGGLVIPRLVASAAELDACARAWGGPTLLLKGPDASRRRVVEELGRGPAVAHFATHVIESSGDPSYGMIALSLTDRGESEVLPPADIAHWRIGPGLVVLSGCHSAAGAAPPGTGLMGLTRAFLAAGAGSVVATRWSTLDEDGALFAAFYRHLKSQDRRDPAGALRAAQLEMMSLGDWRSTPRYWGAYFAVGGSP